MKQRFGFVTELVESHYCFVGFVPLLAVDGQVVLAAIFADFDVLHLTDVDGYLLSASVLYGQLHSFGYDSHLPWVSPRVSRLNQLAALLRGRASQVGTCPLRID